MNLTGCTLAALLCPVVALVAGCERQQPPQAATPPTAVSVSKPAQSKVSDFVEFTGTTEAVSSVDVRARVKGVLKSTKFADGSFVKEGDLLFEIEPDVFEAEVAAARAQLQAAQARLAKATADLAIKKEMAAGNAASKLEVIQAEAAVGTATADVALANAQIQQASIDLGYTRIVAPISGRIDKSRVSTGNLVGSDGNTLLANIVQADPIYVNFDVDEPTIQRFQARMRAQKIDASKNERPKLPIQLALGDSPDFRFQGFIDYADNKVDPATGTIRIRGTIPNHDGVLVPGFFARVRVPEGDPYDAILIPERAIGLDQGQKYVLVVNQKNVVESRPIDAGSAQGRLRVVKSGVSADDWVITDGLLRTRPGATVAPREKPLAPTTAPAVAAAMTASAAAP